MRLLLLLALLAVKVSGTCLNMIAAVTMAGGKLSGKHRQPEAGWSCPRGPECRYKYPSDDPRGEIHGYKGTCKRNAPLDSEEYKLGFHDKGERAHKDHRTLVEPPASYVTHPPPCASIRWPNLQVLLQLYTAGADQATWRARSCEGREEAQVGHGGHRRRPGLEGQGLITNPV